MDSKDKEEIKVDFTVDWSVFESQEFINHNAIFKYHTSQPNTYCINGCLIYTAELSFILRHGVSGFDNIKRERFERIETFGLIDVYKKAYLKGVEFFKSEYLKTDIYSMPDVKFWVQKIDRLYNKDGVYENGTFQGGWNIMRKKVPLKISNETLEHFGFYSGVLSYVERFCHENQELFKAYEIGEKTSKTYSSEPEQSDFDIAFDKFFLDALKDEKIIKSEFERLRTYLSEYFESSEKTESIVPVKFLKVDKKMIGSALNLIHWHFNSKGIDDSYFDFIVPRIAPFKDFGFNKFKTVCQNNIGWKGQK